jgi:hypothetical protein
MGHPGVEQRPLGDGEALRSDRSGDYRDILYWAEYYDRDPILPGRDPKQMGEIATKVLIWQSTHLTQRWGRPRAGALKG